MESLLVVAERAKRIFFNPPDGQDISLLQAVRLSLADSNMPESWAHACARSLLKGPFTLVSRCFSGGPEQRPDSYDEIIVLGVVDLLRTDRELVGLPKEVFI